MKVGTGLGVSSGTVSVTYGTSNPTALGTASAGQAATASRSDHIHPKPTPADLGAPVIPITANMGNMTNNTNASATVTITKTVTGVTSDMVADAIIADNPNAFLSSITCTTSSNSVQLSATIDASSSSAVQIRLINNSPVTGT